MWSILSRVVHRLVSKQYLYITLLKSYSTSSYKCERFANIWFLKISFRHYIHCIHHENCNSTIPIKCSSVCSCFFKKNEFLLVYIITTVFSSVSSFDRTIHRNTTPINSPNWIFIKGECVFIILALIMSKYQRLTVPRWV